jgi:hyperosmotically inducible protein
MLSYALLFLSAGIIIDLLRLAGTTWINAEIVWGLPVIGIIVLAIHLVRGDHPIRSDSLPASQTTDKLERSFTRQARAAFALERRFSLDSVNNARNKVQDFTTGSPSPGALLAIVLVCRMVFATPMHAEESAPKTQATKPPPPKVQEHKTPELKNPEPHPPELKQEPKVKGSTDDQAPNKPGRSLILTVKLALMADQRTAPYTMEVDTKGQDVILSGKVSSEAEQLAAADVVRQVDGVKSVANKLEIVPELHKDLVQKRNQIITEYVRERFKKSATLEAANFEIKTENGVVELSGKTRFQVIVLEAAQAARQVPGVKAVKTNAVRIENAD